MREIDTLIILQYTVLDCNLLITCSWNCRRVFMDIYFDICLLINRPINVTEIMCQIKWRNVNPLNPELNHICHLLALLGAHHILHVSMIRVKFDLHMSVHRNIIQNYSQQDSTFLDLFIFTDALHVSGGSSAHH